MDSQAEFPAFSVDRIPQVCFGPGRPRAIADDAAADFVRTTNAGLVICLGGGSAMDIGKLAATVAVTGDRPTDFAMEGEPLPRQSIPKICVPTTTGTGSELSATNVFADRRGRKVWVCGSETKPDRVILDPELTPTRPPQPTAWTGLDAFAHALESCTNMRRHPAVEGYFNRSSKNASTFSHASAAACLR